MGGNLRQISAVLFILGCLAIICQARVTHGSAERSLPLFSRRQFRGAGWRLARARYEIFRRGLYLGLPPEAYAGALRATRRLESHAQLSTAGTSAAINVAPAFTWSPIGPQPILNEIAIEFGGTTPLANATGRITAIVMDPNSDDLFVGAAGGGVWRSADGGKSFVSVFDSQPTQAIGAIAIDPTTTPSTVYVGTGEGNEAADSYYGQGVFKSTDLGASWTMLGPSAFQGMGIAALALDSSYSPPHLFAALTNAVSAGRGDPNIPEGYASHQGLWKSLDGGVTWSQVGAFNCSNCPANDVVVDPNNPSNIWAAIEFDDVYHSTDGGVTWTPVCFTNDSPCSLPSTFGQIGRDSIALAAGAPGVVYAMVGGVSGAEYVGLFKSIDNGVSWTEETVPTVTINGVPFDGTSGSNLSQSFYDQAMAVDPTDDTGQHLIFGGVGIYETFNSGASWSFLANGGTTHVDQHAVVPLTKIGTMTWFLLGNDGGVYRYDSGAKTFTALNSTISASQMQAIGPHPSAPSKALGGFQDNGTVLFSGATGWAAMDTGDGGFTLFDPSDPSYAYHT